MSALGAGMDCAITRSWEAGKPIVVSMPDGSVMMIVPDVFVVEAAANGVTLRTDEGHGVIRTDGRTAWLYQVTPDLACDLIKHWFSAAGMTGA